MSDTVSSIAFIVLELSESWGVMTPAAKRSAMMVVDEGLTPALLIALDECEISRVIQRWLQSGEASRWTK